MVQGRSSYAVERLISSQCARLSLRQRPVRGCLLDISVMAGTALVTISFLDPYPVICFQCSLNVSRHRNLRAIRPPNQASMPRPSVH